MELSRRSFPRLEPFTKPGRRLSHSADTTTIHPSLYLLIDVTDLRIDLRLIHCNKKILPSIYKQRHRL